MLRAVGHFFKLAIEYTNEISPSEQKPLEFPDSVMPLPSLMVRPIWKHPLDRSLETLRRIDVSMIVALASAVLPLVPTLGRRARRCPGQITRKLLYYSQLYKAYTSAPRKSYVLKTTSVLRRTIAISSMSCQTYVSQNIQLRSRRTPLWPSNHVYLIDKYILMHVCLKVSLPYTV